jgi:GntR family transcriptional regulator
MLKTVNIRSNVAVYVQIENQVRFAVASGKLKAGDQLPSVRELSERLNINPNTVAKAYRDLEVMGYLYTRRGMGVFINKGVSDKCKDDCRRSILSRLYEVLLEAKAAGLATGDIKDSVQRILAMDGEVYSEVPEDVLAFGKKAAKK